jgi:hypothetical protein
MGELCKTSDLSWREILVFLGGHEEFFDGSDTIDIEAESVWQLQSCILERVELNHGSRNFSFYFCDRQYNSSWNLWCEKGERGRAEIEHTRFEFHSVSSASVRFEVVAEQCSTT